MAEKKTTAKKTSTAKKTATKKTAAKKPAGSAKKAAPTAKAARPRRAVVVGGARTPFVKAFGPFTKLDSIALADRAVKGMLDRLQFDASKIEAVVWGGVILPPTAPNIARELALDLGLPAEAEGHTVTRACASGLQAITDAVSMIERGHADIVIAGGSDSTSNAPITLPQHLVHALAPYALGGKKLGPKEALGLLRELYPFSDLLPKQPKIAERTTGEVMGESAEKMAEINKISREEQDRFALQSHQRAAAAWDKGIYDNEVVPVTTPDGETISRDGLVRPNTSLEKLATLKPVFKEGGTLTAGNSSPLTDGAAAVLLMSEEKAEELGLTPLATLLDWSYVGVDPRDQLLIGPAIAMPKAVVRAGLSFDDIDFFDIHEAFAAQVLSVLKVMADDTFCKERIGLDKAFGAIDWDKLNLFGGSVALGHPFGATGARMVLTVANELARRGGGAKAALGICAAGGLGAGAVMSAV